MATYNSDTVARILGEAEGVAGTKDLSHDREVSPYQSQGRVRVAYGKVTFAASSNGNIGRICYLPKNARVVGGSIKWGAFNATTTTPAGKLGLIGKGGSWSDDDLLDASIDLAAAGSQDVLQDVSSVQTEVGDDDGAFVALTLTAAGDASNVDVEAVVFYVVD